MNSSRICYNHISQEIFFRFMRFMKARFAGLFALAFEEPLS